MTYHKAWARITRVYADLFEIITKTKKAKFKKQHFVMLFRFAFGRLLYFNIQWWSSRIVKFGQIVSKDKNGSVDIDTRVHKNR